MARAESIEKAIASAKSYLDRKSWTHTFNEGTSTFETVQSREVSKDSLYLRILEEREQFLFYIVPEFDVTPDLYAAVVEYVTRVNSGIRIGNFEFDLARGKLRFKSSINFRGVHLSETLVENAVEPSLKAWAEYLPGLFDVITGLATPIRAINKIDYED